MDKSGIIIGIVTLLEVPLSVILAVIVWTQYDSPVAQYNSTVSIDTEAICYGYCGCFDSNPPFNGTDVPDSPENQTIVYQLYTQDNKNVPVVIKVNFISGVVDIPQEFESQRKTKFLFHGWFNNPGEASDPGSQISLKNELLEYYNYNVIVVDWSVGAAKPTYFPAVANTRVVGACTGYLTQILTGGNTNKAHCIGHSLGAHICGYAGKFLNGELGRVTGLDPAGTGFFEDNSASRLDSTDARFVDVINCDSLAAPGSKAGHGAPLGHVNFYPHNGGMQPRCSNLTGVPAIICNHRVCRDYFKASIHHSCSSLDIGQVGNWTECYDCNYMGLHADGDYPGNYYIAMDATWPFCPS